MEEGEPIETSDTDPENVNWGVVRSACHAGEFNEGLSSLGKIEDRHSPDNLVTIDNSDFNPDFKVSLIGYKPCVDGECTGEVFGVARLEACVVSADYPSDPECYQSGFEGDVHSAWFLWQGVVSQSGANTSRVEAVFGNQFAPATARMTLSGEDPIIEWDFVGDYPTGTEAPFPSDDLIGELVFAYETFNPAVVGSTLQSLANELISSDAAIYGSFDDFVACQN